MARAIAEAEDWFWTPDARVEEPGTLAPATEGPKVVPPDVSIQGPSTFAPTAGGAEARTSDAAMLDAKAPLDKGTQGFPGTQGSPDVDHTNSSEGPGQPRNPPRTLEPGENSDGTHPSRAPFSNGWESRRPPRPPEPGENSDGTRPSCAPFSNNWEPQRPSRPPEPGGTHEEDAYLATLGIATTTDTVELPPTDHQAEHPDVPVGAQLNHFSVPCSRGASYTPNLIGNDISKSPFSSPRPPGRRTTPHLAPDAGGDFNIDVESISLSYTQMTASTEADQSQTTDSNISKTAPEKLDTQSSVNYILSYIIL